MDATSATLLERVRNRGDQAAWRDFYGLYHPLIVRYARGRGLGRTDAEEIAQACMKTLAERMPRFRYSREQGRFKNYLRTTVENHIKNSLRGRRPRVVSDTALDRVPAAGQSGGDWDHLWLRQHLSHCLERLDLRCADQTVQAFRLYCLEGWPVERVCAKLDLTANQVYLAKTRMIRRLRQEATALVGDVL